MRGPDHRFYVSSGVLAGPSIHLSGPLAHRIARVLRLAVGDEIALFDGSGVEVRARLTAFSRDMVEATVIDRTYPDIEPPVSITLCQALLPSDRFEWVLEKGAEMGVSRFVPLLTERCTARPPAPGAATERKLERWRAVAVAGAELSGRVVAPDVVAPQGLAEALAGLDGPAVMAWEEAASPIKPVLADLAAGGIKTLALIVGPAGGLTAAEAGLAAEAGARVVSLGPRVMRAETAAIVFTALCLHELGGFLPAAG